jgi:hypothetical protein
MHPLAILLTNLELDIRGGTQLYLRDVALGLQQRGHRPIVYSPRLGGVAGELAAATIPVTDDLRSIAAPPDIIHGHHNHELFTALLHFPGVPAIRICHGWLDERPQPFPRVRRYIAVDDTTRDRCVYEWGIPEDRLDVLLNFVDLGRFPQRARLPPKPVRALVFSNGARDHLWAVKRACEDRGISVDAVGHSLGNATAAPESLLGQYDLAFAKGRSALEALATGCAVVLCDAVGVGPMVSTGEFDRLRRLNFGIRTLRQPIATDVIDREVAKYDAEDAAAVSHRVRTLAGREAALDSLIACYQQVIDEHRRSPSDPDAELRAAGSYFQVLAARVSVTDTPARAVYVLLRSLYFGASRIPVVRRLVGLPAIRRLAWRARVPLSQGQFRS